MLQGIKIAGGRSALGADFGIFVKKVLSRGAADLDGENKTVMYNIIEAWHWKGLKIFFFDVCLRKCQLGDYMENLVWWMFMWEVLAQTWSCRFYLCNQSVVSLVPKIFDRMFLFLSLSGRLREGDQLLEVNGCSLLGVSNDK